jgi:hypothetical protein
MVSGPIEVQLHHTTTFYGYAVGNELGIGIAPTGTVTLKENGSEVQTWTADNLQFDFTPMALGTYTFIADYAGDDNFQPSTSEPFTVKVVADVVDATVSSLPQHGVARLEGGPSRALASGLAGAPSRARRRSPPTLR